MKLFAPNKSIFLTGILFGIAGIVGQFGSIEFLTDHSTTLLMVGWLELAIGPLIVKKV